MINWSFFYQKIKMDLKLVLHNENQFNISRKKITIWKKQLFL